MSLVCIVLKLNIVTYENGQKCVYKSAKGKAGTHYPLERAALTVVCTGLKAGEGREWNVTGTRHGTGSLGRWVTKCDPVACLTGTVVELVRSNVGLAVVRFIVRRRTYLLYSRHCFQ